MRTLTLKRRKGETEKEEINSKNGNFLNIMYNVFLFEKV